MNDTEVNRQKRELIQTHGLANCKIAVKHLVATGFEHSNESLESFKEVVGAVFAQDIRDIIQDLDKMDRRVAIQVVKRLL